MKVWIVVCEEPMKTSVRAFSTYEAAHVAMVWMIDSVQYDVPTEVGSDFEIYDMSAYGPDGFGYSWTIHETEVE